MYFPDDDSKIENIDSDTINELCIICLESNDIISIKKNYEKYNHCECNYYIHTNCLEQWKNIKNKCPICHFIFPEKEEEEIEEEEEEECQKCYYLIFLKLIFVDYEINHRNICLLMIHYCMRLIILIALFTNIVFFVLIFNFLFYIF
jgi:hypothetical protein